MLGHGKEFHLKVMSQLHFPSHPLLGQAFPDEPMVLQRRAHLAGNRSQELLVAGGETTSGPPPSEVDDANGSGFPGRRGVPDGNTEEGFTRLHRHRQTILDRCRLGNDDGTSFSKDLGRHRFPIRHGQRPSQAFFTHRRHELQKIRLGFKNP
jgi:hypothetical protein